jgi:conjugative transfer region lipoprotein (TIGR03751 family)
MHNTCKLAKLVTITLVLTSVLGCSSKEAIIPQSEVNIADVYNQQTMTNKGRSVRMAVNVPLAHQDQPIDAYQLHNMKRTNFMLLPNPTLYMYVNTKLSAVDRAPIPAFLTEFKMFERDEYALPSEININWGTQ